MSRRAEIVPLSPDGEAALQPPAERVTSRKWLTEEQYREIVPIPHRSLERQIANGTVTAYRWPGGKVRYFRIEDAESPPLEVVRSTTRKR
jgi:hypothetical protein